MQGSSLSTKCLPKNTASNPLGVGGLYHDPKAANHLKVPLLASAPNKGTPFWPRGQVVKTPPFHGGDTGSTPVGVTRTNYKKGDQKNEKKRTV